jgi:hypothetical protein
VWVGGSDVAKEGAFKWCVANKEAIDISFSSVIAWGTKQPDNVGGNEHCMQANIQSGLTPPATMVYFDDNCANLAKFVCEVRKFLFYISR